jgi:uncharacterized membrane protein
MFGVTLHELVVHFPVSLAAVACGYDLWGLYAGPRGLHGVASGLLRLAALAAIVAMSTGLGQAGMSGLGSQSSVTGHAGVALVGTGLLAAVAGMRYTRAVRSGQADAAPPGAVVLAEVVGVLLVGAATVMGHRI